MNRIAHVGIPLRIPSINSIIYRNVDLRLWHRLALQMVKDAAQVYIPTDKPVMIRITAEYSEFKYTVDADNLYVKPLIDGLKGNVINQGGFQEVIEVRKRSRNTNRNYVTIDVFEA